MVSSISYRVFSGCTNLESILKNFDNHKLCTIAEYYGLVNEQAHRALSDCYTTHKCYLKLRNENGYSKIANKEETEEEKIKPAYVSYGNIRAKDIISKIENCENSSPLYNKVCVITGELTISRAEAMQYIADLGGKNSDNVTLKTDYLIVGNNDHTTGKLKRAEELIGKGQAIKIITEDKFKNIKECVLSQRIKLGENLKKENKNIS